MKNSIISHEHNMTHTEIIKMDNDWTYRYDCIMKEFNIPTYAARVVTYNPRNNETVLKFTWTTIEKGIE